MPQTPSTRWCPTPEQLMILEEMYRSGIRTPNATQIQQITAHLSHYGKIEGKNVFYWFQNHKARDRQKLRRRLSKHHQMLQQQHHHPHPNQQQQQQQAHQLHHLEEPSPSFHHQTPPPFLQQGVFHEATQGMDLLCKLEMGTGEEEPTTSGTKYPQDWTVMMDVGLGVPPCCRPLKTLDLFPTKSTGLKDECSSSKSSSCSTSTN